VLDQHRDTRCAALRKLLDLRASLLLAVDRRARRAFDAMQIGLEFTHTTTAVLDGIGDALALGQLRRLDLHRFKHGASRSSGLDQINPRLAGNLLR